MDIKIIVATHKEYWMPSDSMYLPVHVGAEGKMDVHGQSLDFGYVKDNTGENISKKNANYCELTGLYWAWKNIEADYIGLVHYRRHFTQRRARGSQRERVLGHAQLEPILRQTDVILPIPRNYFIETNYSQYAHAHHAIDLDTTRSILSDRYPNYLRAYDSSMKKTIGHRFNMFIMKQDKFEAYCQWLFDVLFELERRLDISKYNPNDARVFGFVSERLLDVWIETNKVAFLELPYVFMEKQNWLIKGSNFLARKVMGHNGHKDTKI